MAACGCVDELIGVKAFEKTQNPPEAKPGGFFIAARALRPLHGILNLKKENSMSC
jgi:hypothetical protein